MSNEYGSAMSMIEDFNYMIEVFIKENAMATKAEMMGLDPRAGYRLYVTDDCIICRKQSDGSLQYYGGFEYVDKDCRKEVGDYVFYFIDDSRVSRHLEIYAEKTEGKDYEDHSG